MVTIKIKKLNPEAKLPCYAHKEDAGIDIFSIQDVTLKPRERRLISTGIAIAIPKGYVSLIWDKSGIANNGVTTLAGVLDSNYRGEYKILLLNIGDQNYEIKKNQKIAQILVQPIISCNIEEVKDLDDTSRGEGNFGSSGLY